MAKNGQPLSKATLSMIAVLLVAVALGSGYVGAKLEYWHIVYGKCCQFSPLRTVVVRAKEKLGLATFYSEFGQDRWVSEAIYPGVRNGFFLDVGSGDGTRWSNTKAVEQKGWTGICIDPFPTNMQDRTCQMFKEVVSREAGKRVKFWKGGFVGGITDTLGQERWKEAHAKAEEVYAKAEMQGEAPTAEFTTVTLGDILERAKAPRFIHFMSLDIEGAELDALKGFPFDNYQIGAMAVEHMWEEPKRSDIKALMESHGYKRVHTWEKDDFYLPANP